MFNPLVAIVILTVVILGISIWAMVTQESDPTFKSESNEGASEELPTERKLGA